MSERDEIEAMLRRLEELRRATGNGELRAAYQAAVEGLDAVVYRLTMLRALESPKPARARCRRRSPPLLRQRQRAQPRQSGSRSDRRRTQAAAVSDPHRHHALPLQAAAAAGGEGVLRGHRCGFGSGSWRM